MVKDNIDIDTASNLFKLLGHDIRLRTLKLLQDDEYCVCELVEIFQTTQPAISQHLRKLKDQGLVQEERRGQWNFYSLNEDFAFYDYLIHLLAFLPNQETRLKVFNSRSANLHCH